MKQTHLKLTYSLLLIFIYSINNYAQEAKLVEQPKNEIKLNTFTLIAFGAVDITYERILNDESSVGLSIYALGQNNTDSEDYRTFSITPYYRTYFSKNYNRGFFLEIFTMYSKRKSNYYTHSDYQYDENDNYISSNSYYETKEYKGVALGISVGGKWVTKKGFVVEVSGGIGRIIIGNSGDDVPIVGRGGISIGKRF